MNQPITYKHLLIITCTAFTFWVLYSFAPAKYGDLKPWIWRQSSKELRVIWDKQEVYRIIANCPLIYQEISENEFYAK